MEENFVTEGQNPESQNSEEAPLILEEIEIEELAIDGICGVY